MFVLKYQQPEEATADVAKIYNIFQQKRTQVPAPLQLMSTSPEMLNLVFSQINYFMHHPTLSFPLLAAIRLLAAQQVCFAHCTMLNRLWLSKTGLSEQDLADLTAGNEVEAFSEAENALLKTVTKVLQRKKIAGEEVQQLREQGWKDSDILDACVQGTNMLGLSCLFEAFSTQDKPI